MKNKQTNTQKKHPVISVIGLILFIIGLALCLTPSPKKDTSNVLSSSDSSSDSPKPLAILRYDNLREAFAGLKDETNPDDFIKAIEKKDLAYTSETYDDYTRVKAAYTKSVSVHKYADIGDYVDAYFSNSGKLDYALYFSKSRKACAVLFLSGAYPDAPADTGYFCKHGDGEFEPCSDARQALASIYNIDLGDLDDDEKRVKIRDWIVEKVGTYDSTKIDALTIIPATDKDGSTIYSVNIDLTWDASIMVSLADDITLMYGDDLAALLVLEYQSVQALNTIWSAPYKDSDSYSCTYEQNKGRMYRGVNLARPKSRKS